MSYKCTLTFLNKVERKKKIIDMYNVALYTKSVECFCIVLMWMFEFVCSYYYIDTDEDVNMQKILKEYSMTSLSRKLMNIWSQFRNDIAHCIFPLDRDKIERLAACELTDIFANFEEDRPAFEEMFRQCCDSIVTQTKSINKISAF